MAERFSWVPISYCSLPGRPILIKSFALSVHMFPLTIHFQVLDKSPLSGPGRGPPSGNTSTVLCSLLLMGGMSSDLHFSWFLHMERKKSAGPMEEGCKGRGDIFQFHCAFETEQDPVVPSWVYILSVFPHFLFVGNRLHSASLTFPEFQKGRFKQLLIREGRECRN